MKSSINILRNILELNTLENHILKLKGQWRIPSKDAIELNLVLDELVTNIIEHGTGLESDTINITFSLQGDKLTIEVIDNGPPFNPTHCKQPDTTLSLEKRKCGGLGILLVRKFSDCCSYTRLKGNNIFSLKKTLTQESR